MRLGSTTSPTAKSTTTLALPIKSFFMLTPLCSHHDAGERLLYQIYHMRHI